MYENLYLTFLGSLKSQLMKIEREFKSQHLSRLECTNARGDSSLERDSDDFPINFLKSKFGTLMTL